MNWLKIVFTYLPIVIQGVAAVETALHGSPGATKKQVILDAITAGADTASTAPDANVANIGKLIDLVVGTLNTSGVFTHAAAATPAK